MNFFHLKERKIAVLEEGDEYALPNPSIIYRFFGYYDDKGITLLIKWIYLLENYPELIRNIEHLISTSPETINVQTNKGQTALHWASITGKKVIVELLLEHNADLNLQNNNGSTALHLASRSGKKEIVKLLLEHNIEVNLQNKNGSTVLHWASRSGKKEIVELLLEYSANPNLQDDDRT